MENPTVGVDNPFEQLGLPARFDLSPAEISRAYLSKIGAAHPDLAPSDDTDEPAAKLNHARTVLANPELRADALLLALGGPAKETDRTLPPGFLASIMERREEIEAALASGGGAARETWQQWAGAARAEYQSRVGSMFRDGAPLANIRRELNAWRYIERLIEQLDPHYDPARADADNRPR